MKAEVNDLTGNVIGRSGFAVPIPSNDEIVTIEVIKTKDAKVWVSLRPIIDSIGLEWAGQRKRVLRNQPQFGVALISSVGKDNKLRKMLCINREDLHHFLDTINLKRTRSPHAQSRLEDLVQHLLPAILRQSKFHADEEFQYAYLKSPNVLKKEPEIWSVGLVHFTVMLVHRRQVRDIHDLLENGNIRFKEMGDGSRWYVAKDLCRLLELSRYRSVLKRVSTDNKKLVAVPTLGGLQKMSAVSIEGLKEIIRTARKPGFWRAFHKYLEI